MSGRPFLTDPVASLGVALGADPGPVAGEPVRWNIAPIHHRMGVLLDRDAVGMWMGD